MRLLRKKSVSLILMLTLALGMAAGCSNNIDNGKSQTGTSKNSNKETITLNVALMSSDWADAAQQMMDAFTKKYPNIKINYSQVPNDTNQEYLQPKAASGSLPDLMTVEGGAFAAQLADSGLLVDLSKTAAANNTIDGLKPVFTSSQGKLFGIPGGLSTTLIYYNKKLFEQAGVTEIPQNWEDFLAVCEKLKSKNITPLIVGGADGTVANTVWSSGFANSVVSKNHDAVKQVGAGKFDFNTSDYADVFSKYKTLYDKGYLIKGVNSLQYTQANDEFMQGKAAMTFAGIWLAGTFMKADFGTGVIMPPWNLKGQDNVPILATETGFAVAEGPHKDAALKLLDFITEGDGYYIYQNKKGNIPMMKNIDQSKIKMDPQISDYVKTLQSYSVTSSLWFEFLPPQVQTSLAPTFQRVLTGELTPKQAAKTTNDLYQQSVKK